MQKKIAEIAFISNETKRVWIGDPCYVIPDELWDSVCDQTFKGEREVGFKIEFTFEQLSEENLPHEFIQNCQGKNASELVFLQCGTAYGDGVFDSNSGFEYDVDSGCLAIIPDYLVDSQKDTDLGHWFEITRPGEKSNKIALVTDGAGEFRFYISDDIIETIFTGDESDS